MLIITHSGWKNHANYKDDPAVVPFFKVRDSLSIFKGCLMFGNRVVVPSSLRGDVLKLLHQGHPGIVRSKMLARSQVWWPSLNSDIEVMCSNCSPCAKVNFKPDPEVHSWPSPKYPFQRVHIDFFPYNQSTFFLFTDAFSRWLFIQHMPQTSATHVTGVLLHIFSLWGGVPAMIVSDNGPPFDSLEYSDFCTNFNISINRVPVYHPESNVFAERSVQVGKRGLRKMIYELDEVSKLSLDLPSIIHRRLKTFLFNYQSTPSTSTGKSPVELLLSFKPRTMLSMLNPRSAISLDCNTGHILENDPVFVRFNKKSPVIKGRVIRHKGVDRYLVDFDGVLKEVHKNQMVLAPL